MNVLFHTGLKGGLVCITFLVLFFISSVGIILFYKPISVVAVGQWRYQTNRECLLHITEQTGLSSNACGLHLEVSSLSLVRWTHPNWGLFCGFPQFLQKDLRVYHKLGKNNFLWHSFHFIIHYNLFIGEPYQYSDGLLAGVPFLAGEIDFSLHSIQTSSGAHPASVR